MYRICVQALLANTQSKYTVIHSGCYGRLELKMTSAPFCRTSLDHCNTAGVITRRTVGALAREQLACHVSLPAENISAFSVSDSDSDSLYPSQSPSCSIPLLLFQSLSF